MKNLYFFSLIFLSGGRGAGNHIKPIPRSPPVVCTKSVALNQFSHKTNSMLKQLQLSGSYGDFGRFVVQDDIVVSGDT